MVLRRIVLQLYIKSVFLLMRKGENGRQLEIAAVSVPLKVKNLEFGGRGADLTISPGFLAHWPDKTDQRKRLSIQVPTWSLVPSATSEFTTGP